MCFGGSLSGLGAPSLLWYPAVPKGISGRLRQRMEGTGKKAGWGEIQKAHEEQKVVQSNTRVPFTASAAAIQDNYRKLMQPHWGEREDRIWGLEGIFPKVKMGSVFPRITWQLRILSCCCQITFFGSGNPLVRRERECRADCMLLCLFSGVTLSVGDPLPGRRHSFD